MLHRRTPAKKHTFVDVDIHAAKGSLIIVEHLLVNMRGTCLQTSFHFMLQAVYVTAHELTGMLLQVSVL